MNTANQSFHEMAANHLSQASLLGHAASALDGSPVLHDVLDKIAEACGPRFEKLAGENMAVTCTLASLTTETAGEMIASIAPAATTALFEMPLASSRLLVSIEDELLQFVIELMCGGTCSEPVSDTRRPGTSIDRQFARIIFNLLSAAIEKECAAFGLGGVIFGDIQVKSDVLALGKRNTKVSVATLAIECLGRRACVRLAFPETVTDRFKLDALPASKKAAHADPEWTERLQTEIGRTVVRLDAFLGADTLTLGQVAALKVGQILTLPKSAPATCELRCDGKPLFRCDLGQADSRYSLRIEENLPAKLPADESRPMLSPFFDPS
jgi:flagellar motor switch protein FliM